MGDWLGDAALVMQWGEGGWDAEIDDDIYIYIYIDEALRGGVGVLKHGSSYGTENKEMK